MAEPVNFSLWKNRYMTMLPMQYMEHMYIYVLNWVRDFMLAVALRMESQEKKCAHVHQE